MRFWALLVTSLVLLISAFVGCAVVIGSGTASVDSDLKSERSIKRDQK